MMRNRVKPTWSILMRRLMIGSVVALPVLVACSLGLDGSKLSPTVIEDAGDATVIPGDGQIIPEGTNACGKNEDCVEKGCLQGHSCVNGVCQFEQCGKVLACQHAACGVDNKCGQPSGHKFVAAHMSLGQTGLSCDSLGRCVTVVYPFAFVGHSAGVSAYPIVDFTVPAGQTEVQPKPVKVEGGDIAVSHVIASGQRAWFLGKPLFEGQRKVVKVGWVDVPVNPTVTTLVAHRASIDLLNQDSTISEVFANSKDQSIMVMLGQVQGTARRATILRPAEGGDAGLDGIPAFSEVPDSGSYLVGSGERVLTGHAESEPPNAHWRAGFIAHFGAGNPALLGEQDLGAVFPSIFSHITFASTPNGAVIAQAATAHFEDAGDPDAAPVVTGVETVSVAWIVKQFDSPTIEVASPVAMQQYDGGIAAPPDPELVGPIAAIGEDSILALQTDDAGTSVRVAKRNQPVNDPGSITALPNAASSYTIYGAKSEVSKREYGYVFSPGTGPADGVKLLVLEVGCAL